MESSYQGSSQPQKSPKLARVYQTIEELERLKKEREGILQWMAQNDPKRANPTWLGNKGI
ncbi:hypothetical protein [Eisenibacter elegans]|uniref:hypothetical protein n=1 Tax=Eisenibacter elegans TaxID=997 RepID=UPI00047A168A|nr:hypothetical protein [Eisenibacter elegans]